MPCSLESRRLPINSSFRKLNQFLNRWFKKKQIKYSSCQLFPSSNEWLFWFNSLVQVVKSGAYLQAQADLRQSKMKTSSRSDVVQEKKDRKEERRKKANEGKIGGGTQVILVFLSIFSLIFPTFTWVLYILTFIDLVKNNCVDHAVFLKCLMDQMSWPVIRINSTWNWLFVYEREERRKREPLRRNTSGVRTIPTMTMMRKWPASLLQPAWTWSLCPLKTSKLFWVKKRAYTKHLRILFMKLLTDFTSNTIHWNSTNLEFKLWSNCTYGYVDI